MLGRLRRALVKAVGGRTFGSEIFYIESCIYIMTLYDLLTSHHMVWLVYDAFYSKGEKDRETYETMLREGIKINFKNFYERSIFYSFSEESNAGKENSKKGYNFYCRAVLCYKTEFIPKIQNLSTSGESL